MALNKLKLNDDKTELLVFRKPRSDLLFNNLKVGSSVVSNTENVRNLGVVFDETLSMQAHVTKLCQNVHFYLKIIRHIRNVLDVRSAKLVVHALVTSRIDYCNSLLFGLPKTTIKKIQKLQNGAARLITQTPYRDHITPVLKALHWLPVEQRIRFKIACLTYRCIHGTAPGYLRSLISVRQSPRSLRSAAAIQLDSVAPPTVFSSRAFAFSAPSVWNGLSMKTRNSPSFEIFKSNLKTELFRLAFCTV